MSLVSPIRSRHGQTSGSSVAATLNSTLVDHDLSRIGPNRKQVIFVSVINPDDGEKNTWLRVAMQVVR